MISKAIVKNTITESIRTRGAIILGIIAIFATFLIVYFFSNTVFNLFSGTISLFSIMLTIGIIDSDISDGKIQIILTKSISCTQFFLSKVLGIIFLGSILTALMTLLSLVLISLKTNAIVDIKMWFLLPIAGIIANILWTLILATLSTFLKGYSNITVIILFSVLFGVMYAIPNETLHPIMNFLASYILPVPDACLDLLQESKTFLSSKLFHTLFYIVLLSIVGPVILNHRELGKK
jgi:hypothetical protein